MDDQEDVTLILEDRKKYEAIQGLKAELKAQEEIENLKRNTGRAVLVLLAILGVIFYALTCMNA